MCGRYTSYTPPPAIAKLAKAVNPVPNVAPSWNIAPSQQATAVRRYRKTGDRHLDLLTWGFVPHWAIAPMNRPCQCPEGIETMPRHRPARNLAFPCRRGADVAEIIRACAVPLC